MHGNVEIIRQCELKTQARELLQKSTLPSAHFPHNFSHVSPINANISTYRHKTLWYTIYKKNIRVSLFKTKTLGVASRLTSKYQCHPSQILLGAMIQKCFLWEPHNDLRKTHQRNPDRFRLMRCDVILSIPLYFIPKSSRLESWCHYDSQSD